MSACVLPGPCWAEAGAAGSANPHTRLSFPGRSAHSVRTYIWAANTNAHPNPTFLQVGGANTGRRVALCLAQRQRARPFWDRHGVRTPPGAGIALRCVPDGRSTQSGPTAPLRSLRLAGDTHPPQGPSCWHRPTVDIICHRRLTLIPPKSPHTVAGKERSPARRSEKQPDQSSPFSLQSANPGPGTHRHCSQSPDHSRRTRGWGSWKEAGLRGGQGLELGFRGVPQSPWASFPPQGSRGVHTNCRGRARIERRTRHITPDSAHPQLGSQEGLPSHRPAGGLGCPRPDA